MQFAHSRHQEPEIEVLPRTDNPSDPRAQMRAIAQLLDSAFVIPGTQIRFGVDAIIGLIPGVGDALGAAISSYIILLAAKAGASRWVLARMIGNVAVETVLGFIPIVGDLFDLVWKANQRNVAIFEQSRPEKLSPAEGQRRLAQTLSLLVGVGAVMLVAVLFCGVLGFVLVLKFLF